MSKIIINKIICLYNPIKLYLYNRYSNIAFIGAGKAAHSLANALKKSGYKISSVISRTKESAADFARKFSIPSFSDDLTKLPKNVSIFFFAVQDNQIKKTADFISNLNDNLNQKLFIHLSGAENISLLKSLKKKGANTASFHIMQTFPSEKIVSIKNCFAAVETESESVEKYLFNLAKDLHLNPFNLESSKKSLYHLAGVFTSNFLVGNLFNSSLILNTINPQINFYDLLKPIINKTLKNVEDIKPINALSGPVERGDIETIKNHIKAMKKMAEKDINFKILFQSYLIQSLMLLKIAEEKKGEAIKENKKIESLLRKEIDNFILINSNKK